MIAYVESAWWDRLSTATLFRYELPVASFETLDDAGMFVSRLAVKPMAVDAIGSLPDTLREYGVVEIRSMPSLSSLRPVWQSSMHASGIRLRNAKGWPWASVDD